MAMTRKCLARGFTLIEVMVSSVILIVAMIGFIAVVQNVLASNSAAHRRTVGTYVRSSFLDLLAVTPRLAVGSMPQNTWFIDECYDADSQLTGSNLLHQTGFTCPQPPAVANASQYQRWLQVTPVAGTTSAYNLGVYVERINGGCTTANRYGSLGCVAADLFLTD
jgi:prepilin-type N-terminal cleavage/methylation domain-containing protein